MVWKILAAACSSALIIAGAVAFALAPRDSGPALLNSTTTTSTTTPPSTMTHSPGYMGGY
jgi:hypothetical protein